MNWILYILVTAAFIYVIICIIYYIIQEKLLFVAKPLKKSYQYILSQNFTEHFLQSSEGGTINSILIESRDRKGLILYFHGNTGSLKRWAVIAAELTTFGYDIMAIDYRGYGKSKGKRNEENFHTDALKVYEFAKTKYQEQKIIIYGRSMGTGVAVKLASKVNARSLILETPYYSMTEAAQYHMPFLPIKMLIKYTFRSCDWIEDVSCPIYIFHGTKDLIIPYSHALKLFKLVDKNEKNQMVTIPRGRHSNLNSYPLFREKMNLFLK